MAKNIRIDLKAEDLKKKLNIQDGKTPSTQELEAIIKPLIPKQQEINTSDIALQASKLAQVELESKIPKLTQIAEQIPVSGKKVRDSLELLEDKDRLDKSAIKGLDDYEEISALARKPKSGGGIRQSLKGVTYNGNETDFPITTGGLTTPYVQFDTTTEVTVQEGQLAWNATDGTLDLGMNGGGIVMQLGQELFTKVRNVTGGTLENGRVVYATGRIGNRPTIDYARADVDATSQVMGLLTEDILDNTDGFVTTVGYVRQIKTNYTGTGIWGTTWVEGDLLYVSKTDAGVLTNIEPSAPHHSDIVGTVGIVGAVGIGSILVTLDRHQTLEQLSDVNGTALTTDGQFPSWHEPILPETEGYFDFDKNINDFVPYVGATTTVDLNNQDLNSVNTLEVKQTTTNAVIVGDVSGDARGVSALDIQSYRADTTKVASGTHSVAVGFSNTASGYRSTASGYYNTASGTASTALGVNSQATGSESVAIGSGTGSSYYGFDLKTQATGANSVSVGTNSGYFGRGNTASAQYSSAFGIGNSASGYKSSASGYNNTALGEYSSAVGSTNIANGYRSTVLGSSNHAQGEYSYVIGSINTAFGNKSTASGYYNTSSGENSVAFGSSNQSNNTVSGYYGTLGTLAIGFANTASGSGYSGAGIIAVGRNNTASGYLAQAFGGSNTASGVSSLAIGEGNSVTALRSIAIGSGIINANSDTLEFGPSNTRKIQISTSAVQPVQTNVQTLGGASNRWSNLFTSKLNVAEDITVARIARTSAYGIATFDFWIDCTANTFAVTFPTAVGVTGKMYIVSNSGTGTITLNTTSSQTISGSASGAITLPQWATITVLSNGANWIKIT